MAAITAAARTPAVTAAIRGLRRTHGGNTRDQRLGGMGSSASLTAWVPADSPPSAGALSAGALSAGALSAGALSAGALSAAMPSVPPLAGSAWLASALAPGSALAPDSGVATPGSSDIAQAPNPMPPRLAVVTPQSVRKLLTVGLQSVSYSCRLSVGARAVSPLVAARRRTGESAGFRPRHRPYYRPYDVDVASTSIQRHGWDIHAL